MNACTSTGLAKSRHLFSLALSVALVALTASTALADRNKPGKPAKGAPPASGFLTDYTQLAVSGEKGRKGHLVYVRSGLSLRATRGFLIRPVEVWFHPEAGAVIVQPDALKEITDYLEAGLRKAFEPAVFVKEPGPGILEVRVAITELGAVKKKRNILGYTPGGFVVSTTKRGVPWASPASSDALSSQRDGSTAQPVPGLWTLPSAWTWPQAASAESLSWRSNFSTAPRTSSPLSWRFAGSPSSWYRLSWPRAWPDS